MSIAGTTKAGTYQLVVGVGMERLNGVGFVVTRKDGGVDVAKNGRLDLEQG
jgi:hypothetical protein